MSEHRATILVLATGGTIGMRETDRGRAPDPDFASVLEAMVAEICTPLRVSYRINHHNPPIHSGNADADTAPRLAAAVRSRIRTVKADGAVILHGTDTLAYTAARLAFEFDGLGVPVVVTGSQLPHGAPGSDARDNVRLAIRTALRAGPEAPVSIAFGGAILPAIRSTKRDPLDFSAFGAARPLALEALGTASALPREAERRDSARVIAFRFVPGVTADDLRAAVGAHPDGLVLECYGIGSGPVDRPDVADALRDITAQIPVVAITQCTTGSLNFSSYAVGQRLRECGVIDGGDMHIESAIAKLGYALDRGVSHEVIRGVMRLNLVGELSAN